MPVFSPRFRQSFLTWGSVIFLAYYMTTNGIQPGWSMQSDFPNYYVSARMLSEGQDVRKMYDNDWFNERIAAYGIAQQGKFRPFPPPTAFLMLPLAGLNPLSAKHVWTVVQILLFLLCAYLLARLFLFPPGFSFLFLLLAGVGLMNELYLGQVYLLMLFAALAGWKLVSDKKAFAGGVVWGLAAAVKYYPVVFLVPFLLKRDVRCLAGFAVGFLFPHVLAFAWMGGEVYAGYFGVLRQHLDGQIEGQSPYAWQFQSWNVLFRTLFLYDEVANPQPVFPSTVAYLLARIFLPVVMLALAGGTVYRFRHQPGFPAITLAVAAVTAFVLLPASATYHFLMLAFPAALLCGVLRDRGLSFTWVFVTYAAVGSVPLILREAFPDVPGIPYLRLALVTLCYATWMILLRRASGRQTTGDQRAVLR
jgi:hypothetical protein